MDDMTHTGLTAAPQSENEAADGRLIAVQDNLVEFSLEPGAGPVMRNEMILIEPSRSTASHRELLRGEVLRIQGNRIAAQVFEETKGLGVGDAVFLTGDMVSITLGPGLLGRVFDGLQAPLQPLADQFGTFLPRGADVPALPTSDKWAFRPRVRHDDQVYPGDVIGDVQEGAITHKIMVPFGWEGPLTVNWVQEGTFGVDEVVARLRDGAGEDQVITLSQRWPIRRPLSEPLVKSRRLKRQFPKEPLVTTQRMIDGLFPVALGGTACIPGPFGAGKTVLQTLIAKFAAVDIVIMVACGERAGEVVEIIRDFPTTPDPRTGGSLMDRTVIICNTSSMPVAARESSLYTGVTIGEYYRQMGLNVLLIADSTSRWAQAMRETSGRLEEIPGDEGFPAYLDSRIRAVYERAGLFETADGSSGSLTMIGTVSPAGGNFDEPVTHATLSTVKCFLGLSADRAYKRFYPAIDPLLSWSRYPQQMQDWYKENMGADWQPRVERLEALLKRGADVEQMMEVTGEDGVSLDDFLAQQQARFFDMVYLQQDAFDDIDASMSIDRQKALMLLIEEIFEAAQQGSDRQSVRAHYTWLTGKVRNLNYSAYNSQAYQDIVAEIRAKLS